MKNILYIIAIFFSTFLVVGCAPVVPKLATKDLVPAEEAKAMDGTWKDKSNSLVVVKFEGGRAYFVGDLYNKNGQLVVRKDSVFIKNIKQTGPATYSCNAGSSNNISGIASYDGECEIKLTSGELQLHNFANNSQNTPESNNTYEIVKLDNEKLFLSTIDRKPKDKNPPPVVTSIPSHPIEDRGSHEISTKENIESNISSSTDKLATVSPKEATKATNTEKKKVSKQVITKVQHQLLDLSYAPGLTDGKMNKSTVLALKKFQQENNLAATGQIDADTINMLQERLEKHSRDQAPPVTSKIPQAEEVVSQPANSSQPAPETEQDSTPFKVMSPLDL